MTSKEILNAVRHEFDEIHAKQLYAPFLPVLERLGATIGYLEAVEEEPDSEKQMDESIRSAQALLRVVKRLRQEFQKGSDVQMAIDEIKAGCVNSDWIVEGDVKQANQDFIDASTKHITQVFLQAGPELDLAVTPKNIRVPVVLVAMTKPEADELATCDAFHDSFPVLRQAFNDLNQHLLRDCDDWPNRYGVTAKQWKPFGSREEDPTIEQLVGDALQELTDDLELGAVRPLVPSFYDISSLNTVKNQYTLRRLRRNGCIIILDVISLRHPKVQREFHLSLLQAFPRAFVVSLAPNDNFYEVASRLAVVVQLRIEEMEFYHSPTAGIIIHQAESKYWKRRLKEWFFNRVKDLEMVDRGNRGVPGFSRQN